MGSQSSLKESIKEGRLCVGHVKHLVIGVHFRPWDTQHSTVATSFKDGYRVLH